MPEGTTRLTVELAEEPTDHRIIGSNAGVKATSVRPPAAVAATGQSRCERRGPVAERLVVVCDVHDTNVVATGHVRLDVAGEVHELDPVSYTHLRAHETPEHLVCRLLLETKNN